MPPAGGAFASQSAPNRRTSGPSVRHQDAYACHHHHHDCGKKRDELDSPRLKDCAEGIRAGRLQASPSSRGTGKAIRNVNRTPQRRRPASERERIREEAVSTAVLAQIDDWESLEASLPGVRGAAAWPSATDREGVAN